MRLFFKIAGNTILILLALIVALELVFNFWLEEKISAKVSEFVINSVESKVIFEDVDLSILNEFPEISLSIDGVSITEAGYKIIAAKKITSSLDFFDLFKNHISLNKVVLEEPLFFAPIDSLGKKYKIRIKKKDKPTSKDNISIVIPQIEIKDALIVVHNEYKKNKIKIRIHSGDFQLESFESLLELKGTAIGVIDTLISRGGLIQTQIPIAAKDATLEINSLERMNQFEGTLQIYQADLKAIGKFNPSGNGNNIDITLEGNEAELNDYISLIPQFGSLNFNQLNADAKLRLSIHTYGLVDPITFPNNDMIFELKDAAFSREGLPGILDSVNFKGHFSNGKERTATTSELVIEHGRAKLDDSYISLKGSIRNFEDPIINLQAESKIELQDVRLLINSPDLEMQGDARINATLNGKLSDIDQLRKMDKRFFNGSIVLENIQIYKTNINIHDLDGELKIENAKVKLNYLKSKYNDGSFGISGFTNNFTPFFKNDNDKKISVSLNLEAENLTLLKENFSSPQNLMKKNSEPISFPDYFDMNCNVKMNQVAFESYEVEKIKTTLELKDRTIAVQGAYVKMPEGQHWINSVSIFPSIGNPKHEIWIKSELNYLNTKKYTGSPETKNSGKPSIKDLVLHAQLKVKKLIHENVKLNDFEVSASLKDELLNISSFGFTFPFGEVNGDLRLNMKDSVSQLSGNSNVSLSSFNIDSIKRYYNKSIPKKQDQKRAQFPFKMEKFFFDISSPQANYQDYIAQNINAKVEVGNGRAQLKTAKFNMFDGSFQFSGHIRKNQNEDVKAFCSMTARNINLGEITSSFAGPKREMFSKQHFKGSVEVDGQVLLKYNRALEHQEEDLVGKINVSLSDGELIKFKPITESLKFIKQANRDTILLANKNVEVLFHNDEVLIPTTTFKSSLSNIEFSGYHSDDFDFGFDILISVGDLLFKSAKKKKKQVQDNTKAEFGAIKHYLEARSVQGKLKIKSMKKKAYRADLRLLDGRYQHVDSILLQMNKQIVR